MSNLIGKVYVENVNNLHIYICIISAGHVEAAGFGMCGMSLTGMNGLETVQVLLST